jgi:cysteine synthase
MKADTILATIGNTPHVRMRRLFGDATQQVWIKSERSNPGGSIKDRIALAMVEDAEASGALKPGGTIIEPTSGNTGIGLAMVAAVKGYKLMLVMPDSMSIERRRLMLAYGASFDLTPRAEGMKGAMPGPSPWWPAHPARGCPSSLKTRPILMCMCAPRRKKSWPTFPTALTP